MRRWLRDRWRQEEGQGLAEYAWILSLIAVVAIAAVTTLGTTLLQTLYQPIAAFFA
jgi:Flp pilus assembly pilin Flp